MRCKFTLCLYISLNLRSPKLRKAFRFGQGSESGTRCYLIDSLRHDDEGSLFHSHIGGETVNITGSYDHI